MALVICVDEHVAFLPSPSVFPDSVFVSAQYPGMPAVETVVGSDGCGALAVPVATPVESGLVSRDFSFASLYPNPSFSGILRAVFTGDVSRLDLFDPAGRQRGALDRVDGSSTLSINRLSSGVYFIRASGPGGHAVRAFVHLGGALELRVDEFPFRAVASADAAGAAKSSSGAQVHVFVRKPGFGVSSSDYVVETGDSVFVVLEPSRVVSVTPVNLLDHYDVLGSGELWVSDLSGTYVVSLSGDSTFVFHSPPSDSLLMAYRNFSSDFPATISSQVFREGVGSYGPVRGSSFGYDTTGVGMDGLIPVSLPPGDVSLSVYAAEDFNDHGETGPFGDRSLWTGFDRFNYFAMMTGAPSLDVWQAYTRPNGSYCWSSDSPVIDIFF
ncbi:T9SS type A sorting domain-containing protein, partial [Rhodocaloribacter sp.]